MPLKLVYPTINAYQSLNTAISKFVVGVVSIYINLAHLPSFHPFFDAKPIHRLARKASVPKRLSLMFSLLSFHTVELRLQEVEGTSIILAKS